MLRMALDPQHQARQGPGPVLSPMPGQGELHLDRPLLAHSRVQKSSDQIVEDRRDRLGRRRRRRRAVVRRKIRQREIDLMADGRHHRHRRVRDRPHHDLVVEAPEILQ